MRVTTLITGGGTGGHVYPALSVLRYLTADRESASRQPPDARAPALSADGGVAYLGSSRGLERSIVPRSGMRAFFFPMAAPRSPRAVVLLVVAVVRAGLLMARLGPRVLFATGGYVSIPGIVAAWLLRVPVVLFLPDVVPGRTVRYLVPLARRLAVATDESLTYVPAAKSVVTGYPVRDVFEGMTRDVARAALGLSPEERVLTVFGGSQGARSINRALAECLPRLLTTMTILHVAGEQRLAEARLAASGLPEEQQTRYRLFPYLHDREMASALAAADLVVCRSGASAIGELPLLGVPSVLVPLPERKVHQRENADYMARHGAAEVLDDADLPSALGPLITSLMSSPERLATMRRASRALARPDAAERIAEILVAAA